MPLDTDLTGSPSFDDYDFSKGYYRIVWRPGLSVQVRELNQFQSMIAKQIELFGDSIFKSGTIIDGCNFAFHSPYPYAKLDDVDTLGVQVVPSNLVNLFATGVTGGLLSVIVNSVDGFESTDPDLKTLYFRHLNAGTDSNTHAYVAGEGLVITDAANSIPKVVVTSPGLAFSNSDQVVFTSALAVNVTSGSFSAGDYVTQPATGANLHVDAIDTATLASVGQIILKVAPRDADLANADVTETAWSESNGTSIHNSGNTAAGLVMAIVGSGASGLPITDGSGRVQRITMVDQGESYNTVPIVRLRSANNLTGLGLLTLTAQNFYQEVTVANVALATGNGYAFSVDEGVIYQKGYFIGVDPQTSIVDKYTQSPNAVSVGFSVDETLISSNQDESLLDNALGTNNYTAPGANRLQLTPTLVVANGVDASGNASFLPIVSWSEGRPFRQNQLSQYSQIGDEMAARTYDEAGNFSVDRFLVTTRSPSNSVFEGNTLTIAIDPGTAYIGGKKVKTESILTVDVPKGLDTVVKTNQRFSLNYGSYAKVTHLGGAFQFSTGDTVTLYDTAKNFLANASLVAAGNVDHVGNSVGTARVRMLTSDSGFPGDANAAYKMYLFNVTMSQGKNFQNVRSIAYGTNAGIADIALELDPTTSASVAILHDPSDSHLVFSAGGDGVRNANNISYRYRTIDRTLAVTNSGTITKSIAGNPDELFPYSVPLSQSDLVNVLVVPTAGNLIATANVDGTVTVNTTSVAAVGSGTAFVTQLAAGDWVWVANSTAHDVRKVATVVNNTSFLMDANCTVADAGVGVYRLFPKNVPVPFGSRSGLTGNVDINGNILTLNFGMAFSGSTSVNCAVAFDVSRSDVSEGSKTAARDKMVKLRLANVTGNTVGPWQLGVSDVIRLKHVYVGNSTVNADSVDVVRDFYVDAAQNPDFVGLAQLKLQARSATRLANTDYLLVVLDALTSSSPGFFDAVSYVTANADQVALVDSQPVANLAGAIHSLEVPCVDGRGSDYWSLLSSFDFRPIAVNAVVASATVGAAVINPNSALSFGNTADPANDRKFPIPGAVLTADVEYYLGRTDSVFAGRDGNITVVKGTPALDPRKRRPPPDPQDKVSMRLNDVAITSYPTVPYFSSDNLQGVMMTRTVHNGILCPAVKAKRSGAVLSDAQVDLDQPQGYTMSEIGGLERRIKALEYIASLSALQTDMANKVIPSSVDPTLNRFKFGFFVDPFDSYTSSNTADLTYAAFVSNGRLYPPLFVWNANTNFGGVCGPGYTHHPCANNPPCTNTPPEPPPPPPGYNGTMIILDYDYSVQHSPYIGVSNPTITSLPVGGWTGGVIGIEAFGLKPSTEHDFYFNNIKRNDIVVIPGDGLSNTPLTWGTGVTGRQIYQPTHGTHRVISDANGHAVFGAFFGSYGSANTDSQTFSDIIETFFQVEVDYGHTAYYLHAGDSTQEIAANYANVYALSSLHADPLKGDVDGKIPGHGWVVKGVMPTLKYNTFGLSAPSSNAVTVAPIWTTGRLTEHTI